MKLYTKIFIWIIIPLTLITCGTVYFNSKKQLALAEEWLVARYMETGQVITGYIIDNHTELPRVAENLDRMARRETFLFWQLRGPENSSSQGGDPSVLEAVAGPDLHDLPARNACGERVVIRKDAGYGVYDRVFQIGRDDYHFQLVFSLAQLRMATRRVVLTHILQFILVIGFISATLYFLSIRVTAPLHELVRNTKIIGRGKLHHRIQLISNDEFGELAASFNEMAANLEKTTFPVTYVNRIFRAMVDGLMVVGPGGKINRVNRALCKLLGYKKQELFEAPLESVFPEARKLFYTGEKWVSPPGGQANYETWYRKKNGEKVPVLLSYVVMKDKTGKEFIICSSRDITERKRIEEELYQAKKQALVTLESIGDLVATTDNQGKITYLNPAGEKITGWSGQEAQGQPFSEVIRLVDEYTSSPLDNLVGKVIAENKIINLQENITLLNRTGRAYAVEVTAAPLHGPGKEITGIVVVIHDFTENKEMLRNVAYQASHDPLTGLVNRLTFKDYLDQAIYKAKEKGKKSILFYLDLDRFKLINDACGHFAGDRLLRQLALIIKATVRQHDIVARLGGDEFGILMENLPLESAFIMAEEICRAVREFSFTSQGKFFSIGVSVGIVEVTAAIDNSDFLLSAADQACSLAKKKGGNTYYLYDKNDPELSKYHGEMFWLEQVNKALEENLFELHYQPIIPVRGGEREVRHEILLRMKDGQGKLVTPEVFFSAAEKHNLMRLIDRWVIRSFCARFAENNRGTGEALSFYNINISGASLDDDTFLPFVKEQLQRYAIPPEVVCFEITERIAVASFHQAVRFIQETKYLGCRFAIDDFGKGISSFNYLKHLPVDYLKIDGGFVRNMLESPLDELIVETINRLGHFLGIKTIAESVESEPIFNRLKELGVDYAQGYWIAYPQRLQVYLPQAGL